MLSTPHMLVGAAIVKFVPNPLISLPLAFLSHFLLDFLPHWDWTPPTPPYQLSPILKTSADLAFGLLIVYFITRSDPNQALLLAGAGAGVLPDFLQGLLSFLNYLLKKDLASVYSDWHGKIQNRLSFLPGLFITTAVVLIGVLIIAR